MLCHYWYILGTDCKYGQEVCNSCHDILMMVYELKDIAILHMKDADYWSFTWNMSRSGAVNRLNNSKTAVKGSLYKSFSVRYSLWCKQNTH